MKFDEICTKWQKQKFDYYYNIHKDNDVADSSSLTYWIDYITLYKPSHTDEFGLFDLFERAKQLNCKIIFVTVHDENLYDITHTHLQHLHIYDFDVYLTNNSNKGIFIKDNK